MTKILIVEDDKILSNAYKITLERAKHEVITVFNGREALEVANQNEPDIILLDILMPEMTGLEFLEHYDLLKSHPNVKVVILSNIGQNDEAQKALDLGAYKYIVKAHATPDDLSAMVNHLIRKNLDTKSKFSSD